MRGVSISEPGDAEVLTLTEMEAPTAEEGCVVIDTAAAGVNRADIMQRRGFYPPPTGASPLPGLEVSGTIREVGPGVEEWSVGDDVCALVDGGGYAEQVLVPAAQLLPVPKGVTLTEAAGLPEVTCTVWSNVFLTANLQPGETFLVHGGSSGIGTMAIQLAAASGATVAATAGSSVKLDVCRKLGAGILVNYKEGDFVEQVREATDGQGADVILDVVGAKYLSANVDLLKTAGRLVIIGLLGGRKGELDLGKLLGKRGAVIATSLRARPPEEKATIVAEVRDHVWPMIEDGSVRPIVQGTHPMDRAADAHREMEASEHIGKILLTT